MSNLAVITMSEKGQVVLPKKTRDTLGLKKGEKLLLVEEKGRVTLTKVSDLTKDGKLSEGLATMLASGKTLKKDWSYKGDDAWDDL